MRTLFDMLGRVVEEGDILVVVEPKTQPFEVTSMGGLANIMAPGQPAMEMVKMKCEIVMPIPPQGNMIPVLIVKKAEKKTAVTPAQA